MATDLATALIRRCSERGFTIAVAESLTGGRLVSTLIDVPGASKVVLGGIVAYNTALKHSLLGVDAQLLADKGAVDPDVATQLATGARERLAVNGTPATIGVGTTGVAGPDTQDGHSVGTVYLGFATSSHAWSEALQFSGSRDDIRSRVVYESLVSLIRLIDSL